MEGRKLKQTKKEKKKTRISERKQARYSGLFVHAQAFLWVTINFKIYRLQHDSQFN